MTDQKLRIIADKMRFPPASLGLLRGKMGNVLFLYHYARHFDNLYDEYANRYLDEITDEIHKVGGNYADGLAGIGTGIEYLVKESLIDGNTNEVLKDFDRIISCFASSSPGLLNMGTGITGYGKYYMARLNNPSNSKSANGDTEFFKRQLSKIVDLLSMDYFVYEDLFFVIHFLPDIINSNINKEKAAIYFNYAVDLLETMVYEDTFFKKYPGTFNPLIAAILLLRSSIKLNNKYLKDIALHFLEKYESGYRPYLAEEYAIKWSFLYHTLGETCNCNIYKKLSNQWLGKAIDSRLNLNPETLILSGMMLLSMNKSIDNNWLDWFPLL